MNKIKLKKKKSLKLVGSIPKQIHPLWRKVENN
jgi:hypothetical protein